MKILFKLTSRSRPEKFFNTINNIQSLISKDCEYRIHCTLDADDRTMNELSVISLLEKIPNMFYVFGISKNKVDAINRDMDSVGEWDILVNMSDDMVFTKQDFDKVITEAYRLNFPDFDGCLHLPDGNQNDRIITLAIIGRKYYERFNYIYNPQYISLWCDMEQTEVAKQTGKYMYIHEFIYKHMHPAWGLASMDEQYLKTESFEPIDKNTYLKRKAAGFVS